MAGKENAAGERRIAIVFQGDATSSAAWSGVPAGLASGLSAAGAEVVPIDASLPGAAKLTNALGMSWSQAAANGALAAGGGLRADLALRRTALEGVVSIGSGFALSSPLPTVSFDDMTLAQALRSGGEAYRSLGEAAKQRWRARQAKIYERSRACCAVSRWTARSIEEDYGVAPERIHVVGLGRNVDAAENPDRDWSAPRFLFAGVDWERKRGAAIVEAFAELRERVPAATLDLVGAHPPVDAPGVTGHGRLRLDSAADQRTYSELLARATCFLMPSEYEPFGIAYVDAGATGIPSIGTTVGGAADAVGPGGILVAPDEERALLAAMVKLSDPGTARRLGGLAFEHSALFTWRAVAERVLRALRAPGWELGDLSQPRG